MSDVQYCVYYKCLNCPYKWNLCRTHYDKMRAYAQRPDVKAQRRAYMRAYAQRIRKLAQAALTAGLTV